VTTDAHRLRGVDRGEGNQDELRSLASLHEILRHRSLGHPNLIGTSDWTASLRRSMLFMIEPDRIPCVGPTRSLR
jgi:hypothetical protein